jgi:RNA polymerase sigma factor (sigma-70 family)
MKLVHTIVEESIIGYSSYYKDFFQEGSLGMLEAIKRYSPDKGKFSVFARFWIIKYIKGYINDNIKLIRIPKTTRSVNKKKGNELHDPEIVYEAVDFQEYPTFQLSATEDLAWALGKLDKRRYDIVCMKHFKQMTNKQIGQKMGLTHERVRQLDKDALKKLKVAMEN